MAALPWSGLHCPNGPGREIHRRACRSSWLVGEETFVLSTDPTRLHQSIASSTGGVAFPAIRPMPAVAEDASPLRPMMPLGPFRLLRRLGQGAQGEVWKARRAGSRGEFVALKVLNRDLIHSPSRLAQFRHEAERGARLVGPSLLRVIEHGEIDNFLYMTMPLIEGATLQQVIRNRRAHVRGEPTDPVHRLVFVNERRYLRAALSIMAGVARALGRIHSGLVVHRDVKPANILVDCRRDCGVYLCDLGLGRDLEHATSQQMRDGAGTPMYMAPERLMKAPADEMLCDIYSLGVTLFETVTLERPFQPPDGLPVSCLSLYLATSLPRDPRALSPGLPPDLDRVILRAMARDPHQRHRSAEEFAADLERIADAIDLAGPSVLGHKAHHDRPVPHTVRVVSRSTSAGGSAPSTPHRARSARPDAASLG